MRKFNFYMDKDDGGGEGKGGERDYAAEAAKMGHKSQEDWTGDPEQWLDAKAFIEKGEAVLPLVVAKNKRLEEKLKAVEAELATAKQDFSEVRAFMKKASDSEKVALQAQLTEALEVRKQAVIDGDGAAFNNADARVEKIKEAAAVVDKGGEQPAQKEHADYQPWVKENQWYLTDKKLQVQANAISASIGLNEGLTGRDLFNEVTRQIKLLNPKKFEDDEGGDNRGGVVEDHKDGTGNGSASPANKKARTYANLPADAKKACDRWISKGYLPGDATKLRQQYADNYQWD